MNATLFICCSHHCPPLLLVSPSDRTLTVENVTEVMGEVGDWERVTRGSVYAFSREISDFTYVLGIPDSKLQEIKQQSYTERDRSRLAGEYWVNTDPRASWRVLGRTLYQEGEETALLMVKQYLPKGIRAFLDYLKLD